jgi:hypothetical protein
MGEDAPFIRDIIQDLFRSASQTARPDAALAKGRRLIYVKVTKRGSS